MNIFHLAEVADIGIEKEKKRRDFYKQVAQNFPEKDIKDLFLRLVDWEESHIERFTQIRNSIKRVETTQTYPGEMIAYMQSLVDDRLYAEVSPSQFSKRINTALDAINLGIDFEKDAILFFGELKAFIDEVNKEVVQKLIDEEKQHIIFLSELRNKMGR